MKNNGGPLSGAGATERRNRLVPVLGLTSLLAVAVGTVVGQGPIVSVLQGVGLGGSGFLLVMLVSFGISICNAVTFAELSLMFPRAGGLSTYTEIAMGNFPAMVATFSGYVVVAMFGLSAEMLLVGGIINDLFPSFLSPIAIGVLVVAFFTVMNILGTDIFARIQNVLAFAMVATLLFIGLAAITRSGVSLPAGHVPFADWGPVTGNVFGLITLAIWAFVGLEFVCPMIEEAKNPRRDIPRSMFLAAVVIGVVYLVFVLGAGTYLTREQLASSSLPHLEYVTAVFGDHAKLLMVVVALTASGSTVNTVLASVARMIYGMAQNGQALPVFKKVHPRYRTPWMAIIFMGVVTAAPLLVMGSKPDALITMLVAAAASWLLAYIIAHIDVIVLRRRMPLADRPFKTPLYPLPQILGIAAMGYAIINNSPSPEMTRTVYLLTGVVIGIVAIGSAAWVRLVMKRGLFEPRPAEVVLKE